MQANEGSAPASRRPPRQLLLLTAILILALALGGLARSEPGGSWLINSFWLLYVVALLPLIALGAVIVITGFLIWTLKDTSDAIGGGIARKAKKAKPGNPYLRLLVYAATWGAAGLALYYRCGGFMCKSSNVPDQLKQMVITNQTNTSNPALQALAGLLTVSSTVGVIAQSTWFGWAFFGLLVVGSVIALRSAKVAIDEMREDAGKVILIAHQRGLNAVNDAIQIVQETELGDPKQRIVICYLRMLRSAGEMGADVTPDQTARELERTIRRTFMLAGNGIRTLTDLFEEARYSIHTMTEVDSQAAYSSLMLIQAELQSV